MKQHIHIISIAFLFFVTAFHVPVHSQQITDNAVFYHSIRPPWSNYLNPALFPSESRWYVTTAKTSLQLSLPLAYQDLGLTIDPERQVTILNVNDLFDKLKTSGCNFSHNADINVLGFGFTIKDNLRLMASAGLRTFSSINVPLSLIDFLTHGNLNDSHHIDFGAKDILNAQAYAYATVGASLQLQPLPLTIGARVNVLNGIASLSADNLSLSLTTAEDLSIMRLTSDYIIHSAGIVKLNHIENQGFQFKINEFLPRNFGFTLDFGVKLETDIFNISASIANLGPGILWQQNPISIIPKQNNTNISFDGIDLSTLITNGHVDTSFLNNIKDSLLSMIDYTTEENDHWYSIPTQLYIGASIPLGNLLRAGYLFQGQWSNGWINNHHSGSNHFACNNTLSAHLNLFNWMELSVANSFTYNGNHTTWLNPGCAITLSPIHVIQVFAAIEYISNINPTKIKSAHIMFGISVVGA